MACIIVGVARRIKYKLGGVLPETTEEILMLEQVGRKVTMVIHQDCFEVQVGLAVDTHLKKCLPSIGWCKKWSDADKVAQEVESWLPLEYYRQVNETFCGLRQVYNKSTAAIMKKLAAEMDLDIKPLMVDVIKADPEQIHFVRGVEGRRKRKAPDRFY